MAFAGCALADSGTICNTKRCLHYIAEWKKPKFAEKVVLL